MSKIIKYSVGILALLLVIWLSLDIQDLEKHRSETKPAIFIAENYVANFWNDSLPVCIANAPEIVGLLNLLNKNPQLAFEKHGRKLGISKTYYFMAAGQGTLEKVEDEFVVMAIGDQTKVEIATDFIYGNSVRDGSGKVNINDFLNMTDFNNVSVAINKLVKEKVVSRLHKATQPGQTLEFSGAFEVNSENLNLSAIRIIPVSIKITNGKSE